MPVSAFTTTGEHSTESYPGGKTVPYAPQPSRPWPRSSSAPPQVQHAAPAVEFGKYMVHERLGTGGMASVHAADLCGPGGFRRRVALKRLLPHVAAEPEIVQLFLDEARLASFLRHPHIATIYDFGKVGGEYFIAMELVRGPSLRQLVRQCLKTVGLIPYPIVIHIISQICDALAYAHDACDDKERPLKIVHRDISPANIVLSSGGIAKLIDFGVAKSVSSHTSAGVIKGKLAYVAPEYLDGQIDRRADLWALGVVAWELLTNDRLFGGDDIDVITQVMTRPILPPSRWNPDVPPELDQIVMTALERDPQKRWQNAGAMRAALQGLARRLGNAPSTGDVAEWVEWAFAQRPSDSSLPSQLMASPAVRQVTADVPEDPVADPPAPPVLPVAATEAASPPARKRNRFASLTQMLFRKREEGSIGADYVYRAMRARRRARILGIVLILAAGIGTAAAVALM